MEYIVIQSLLLLLICITSSNAAADILQNPDFEIPPLNITENATSQFLLLHNDQNRIPGWSFNGTVWYVTPAANLSIGHAIRLGENGRINQSFKGVDDYASEYALTFTLAAQNDNCFNNSTAVNVSFLGPYGEYGSQLFSLERNLSRTSRVSFGFYLGSQSSSDFANIVIKSVAVSNPDQRNATTCWPIVDNFIVQRNGRPILWYNGNSIPNGDFEVGPAFIQNTSGGILLHEEPNSGNTGPLQRWEIIGTVKYIDSKHFKVPQGNAAIELISSYERSGIRADFSFGNKQTYTLNFAIGDANDSCVGDLLVFLQVGNDIRNYTLQSNGMGSAYNYSVTFVASESWTDTPIVFYGDDNQTWATDGVLCGPVLDSISLYVSSSVKQVELWGGGVILSLVLGLMMNIL